jgi:superfamily I DNA and/or RNA helicase/very-short-patch-repair endonuclease/DNA-directed RNA polymerase subunit L
MKKEKYLQIFNYLLEFSKLRTNPVRNIESSETQYPEILWLADIPQYDIFDCITFPTYNQDADYWLKIKKPKEEPLRPTFPKISKVLTEWIVEESLIDENGTPLLKDKIEQNGKEIFITDKPEVEAEFQKYINDKWIDDLEFYKKEFKTYETKLADYEKQSKIYKNLFTIYNKAQQFGEEYELIVGVGLLNFKENSDTPLICRHILTSKTEISFEFSARESFVKVSPSIENEIQIETDAILDLSEQFDAADIIEAENKVAEFLKAENITDSPFDNHIKEAIQIFADRLRTDGRSKDDLAKPKEIPSKPTVYFAPALILRKRNTRSFTALYEKIIENISGSDNSINIPSINDIIGYLENHGDFPSDSENQTSNCLVDETIYFPKEYNAEQIEIIEKARRNKKVLVQGPPGTGKSHTIANLICHLLAKGKKVLVTAYTKRALEVLKNQLPKDFQNLTVSLLSGDSTSIQDLDASVNAINDELSRITDLDDFKKRIEKKESEYDSLKEQKAETINEWLKVKEQSTRRQNINRCYQGTLLEIAEKIEKDIPTFVWFKDEVTDNDKINLISDIEEFCELTKFYQKKDCSVFNYIIPQKKLIISIDELKEYLETVKDLAHKYPSKDEQITIKSKDYIELKKQLKELLNLFLSIEDNVSPFKSKIISDYPKHLVSWKGMLKRTNLTLLEMPDETLITYDKNVEIQYPKDKSLIQVKNDAQTLLSYIKEGNSLSGVLFNIKKSLLPKNIKEKLYFIEKVKVNGSDCDTAEEIQIVLSDIKIKQDFQELENIWEVKPDKYFKSYFEKANFYRKLHEDIESLFSFLETANDIKENIKSISSVRVEDYKSATVQDLIGEVDFNILLEQNRVLKEKISETNKYLSIQNIHPIVKEIKKAIATSDIDKFEQLLSEIDTLNLSKEKYQSYMELLMNLEKYFPKLVKDILGNTFDSSNFRQLENAIYFKNAFAEITKLLAADYETELACKLSDIERLEKKLISTIASKKAWLSVLNELSNDFLLRKHLQAWVLAVRKIGKTGKGKRALKFRKEAQSQMEKCKNSVPCWIMPLYKVAETINPEQEMYDYVIIDEASQLGADAIFLLYISKNIIIVGDDKQTSPEYVGVDANTMEPHIKRHLIDIPFANYYGTEFSFFDHAKMFCNGMTVLREHFRCMPEIIEFCNKHFYAPDGKGLYPLKQYSENRIAPLEAVYCQNGYVDGTYQNITNKIEAESIAGKIAELVKDDNYKGKTFGVIALQGTAQAKIIESKLIDKIGSEEIAKRKIICGNSASYQGDERDVMFLSLVTAHNHNRASLTKPEDERRFNVAISRAKEQAWLFHSVQLDDLSNTNDLRYKLLDHFLNYRPQPIPPSKTFERKMGTQPEPFESWFEVDVYNDIVANNYNVIPQYKVAKGRYRIDLVTILSNGIKLAIECDGDKYHGPEQYQDDFMREKVLTRCGWQFFRVKGGEYYSNRKKALEPLWKLLKDNNNQKDEFADVHTSKQNYEEQDKNETFKINIKETKNHSENIKNNQEGLFDKSFKMENPPQIDSLNKETVPITLSKDFSFSDILVFTSAFNVYKVQKKNINDRLSIMENIDFEPGEKSIYTTGTNDYSGYLIVAFENGKVAKITLKSYQTEYNRKKLKNAFNNESKLIFIEHVKDDIDLVTVSSINKIILFNTSQINPVESKTTKGVQVMKSKDNSKMIKVKRLNQVKFADSKYYCKNGNLNVVGYYLKFGDKI